MKLGLRLESLGLPFRQALSATARLEVGGVQLDAVGELAPDRLTATGRKELRHLLRSHSIELTALHCPLRQGLDQPLDLQPRIEHVMKVLALSFELGAKIVVISAGQVPEAEADPRRQYLREALMALDAYGDRVGATLAIETGLESGEALSSFLSQFDNGGLGVNYDPANLLIHGFDPVSNLAPLRDRIVHTHARDARVGNVSRGAVDAPIGHGDIEWMSYLGTLSAQEFRGWVVVETDVPDARAVEQGIRFLRRLL